jgi:IS5 family transposase
VRGKAAPNQERLRRAYGRLLEATGRVLGQATRFSREIGSGLKRGTGNVDKVILDGLGQTLDSMAPLVRQVIRQTKARIFGGDRHSAGKLVSLFEPSTEIIRKGKAGKPTEFGKLVKLEGAENQITVDYEVYPRHPNDVDLLTGRRDPPRQAWTCAASGRRRRSSEVMGHGGEP